MDNGQFSGLPGMKMAAANHMYKFVTWDQIT